MTFSHNLGTFATTLSGILWFWCPCVAQGATHVKMVRPRGPHLKSNLSHFLQNCMFLLKCFLNMVFLPFWGDRKGRQEGFRSRGSVFFTFAPILKKTSKGDHFGTLVESICRLKSFMGRYRNSRTKTRDISTPPPGYGHPSPPAPSAPEMSGHAGPMEPFGEEN